MRVSFDPMHKAVKHIAIPAALAGVAFLGYLQFSGMRHADLAIFTKDNRAIHFNVEIAETSEQGKKGLMGRDRLDANKGMLFLIPEGQIVWMWMKDTQIPIDMVFINREHKISKIVAHNQPLDETPIQSDGPVSAILEIGDNLTRTNLITVGDTVDWPQ